MAENIHNGHRERMFERVLRYGWSSLSDHELIEMMLFYSIPRVNTNGIAHALLDKFGSVKGVLDASQKELMTVKGVGEKSAHMIKMQPELLRRYLNDSSDKAVRYDTMGKVGEYLYRQFVGLNYEKLYMMMFNNRLNLLDCVQISEGVINCSEVAMRKVSEFIVYRRASVVLFAHNHPDGMAVPSQIDRDNTEILRIHVENMGVQMLDHLVFADQKYASIMKKSYGTFRVSPVSQKIDQEFFEHFYEGNEGNDYRVNPDFPGFTPQ